MHSILSSKDGKFQYIHRIKLLSAPQNFHTRHSYGFSMAAKLRMLRDSSTGGGGARGVMVKAMDCGIVVSEFELQSRYYVHFRTNTPGKGMNPLILPAMGEIVPLLFF